MFFTLLIYCPFPLPGLWIRIDSIRIQHFSSIRIRIRIQAKTELSNTISFSNFFESKIWVKSNKKVVLKITKKYIFQLKFLNFLAPGSGIRIPNPDPQSPWGYGSGSTTLPSSISQRQVIGAVLNYVFPNTASCCGSKIPLQKADTNILGE
jgi:hypothetical protein